LEVQLAEAGRPPDGIVGSPVGAINEAIACTWPGAVSDVAAGRADLSGDYLADLHRRLASVIDAAETEEFAGRGPAGSWEAFVAELTADGPPEEAYVLAELCWGGHVRSLAFSLGWVCLNQCRLRAGAAALYPPPRDQGRLVRCLRPAGPPNYDAEPLRGLLWEWDRDQQPA
jgi:hypothetical protein